MSCSFSTISEKIAVTDQHIPKRKAISHENIEINVQTVSELRDLDALASCWDDLTENTVEPNVFYERWMLMPAWREFACRDHPFLVLVWLDNARSVLGGLIPVCRDRGYRRIPVRRLTTWKHLHCFSRVPLIREGFESQCIEGFLDWMGAEEFATLFFSFMDVDFNGPFAHALQLTLQQRKLPCDTLNRFARPMIRTSDSYQDYLQNNFKRKARRNLKHSLNTLQKIGEVAYNRLTTDASREQIEQWLEEFLTLENSGWKGREGTALACNNDERRFFRDAIARGVRQNQALLLKLSVDGQPVAMYVNLLAKQSVGFCFKIAFDENLAKVSPGVLLGHETTRIVLDELQLDWVDSCAQPGHSLFSHLWKQERLMGHIHIGQDKLLAGLVIKTMTSVKKIYDAAKKFKEKS